MKKNYFIPLIVFAFVFLNVNAQKASFNIDKNNICVGDFIQITNLSSGATTFNWDFDDGTSGSQTDNSFTKKYSASGSYVLRLIAEDNGKKDTSYQVLYVADEPTASFWLMESQVCFASKPSVKLNPTLSDVDSVLWDFGDGKISKAINAVHKYKTAGTYAINLTAYGKCGIKTHKETLQLFDDANGKAEAKMSVSSSLACSKDSISFYNNSENYDSIQWEFGDGNLSIEKEPIHVYAKEGSYTAKLIVFSDCGVDTASTVIEINDNKTNKTSISVSPWNNENCVGSNFNFSYFGSTAKTAKWEMGDGEFYQNETYITHKYSKAGTYTVKLILENSCGKQDTVEQNVTVKGDIIPDAGSLIINKSNICLGEKVSVTNYADNLSKKIWEFGDGISVDSLGYSVEHTYVKEGIYTFKLRAQNACGNWDTLEHTFTVGNNLDSYLSIYSSNSGAGDCFKDSINFYHYSDAELSDFVWNFGDGNTYKGEYASHVYSKAGKYTVLLTAKNKCNVTVKAGTFVYTNAFSNPEANYYLYPSVACKGQIIMFDNFTQHADSSVYHYGNGDVEKDKGFHFHNYSFNQTGKFEVMLVAHGRCANDTAYDYINVIAAPSVSFSVPANIVKNNSVAFNATIVNAVSYYWTVNDTKVEGNTTLNYIFTKSGKFEVALIAYGENGCESIFSQTVPVDETVSANSIGTIDRLTFYPNPTKNEAFLQLQSVGNQIVYVKLFDLNGKLLMNNNLGITASGTNIFELNFEHLASGLYHLIVELDGNIAPLKIQVIE